LTWEVTGIFFFSVNHQRPRPSCPRTPEDGAMSRRLLEHL